MSARVFTKDDPEVLVIESAIMDFIKREFSDTHAAAAYVAVKGVLVKIRSFIDANGGMKDVYDPPLGGAIN